MSIFSKAELDYLAEGGHLGRLATVDETGLPHVVRPRAVEVRGTAEAIYHHPAEAADAVSLIRLTPIKIASWGLATGTQ